MATVKFDTKLTVTIGQAPNYVVLGPVASDLRILEASNEGFRYYSDAYF